MKTIAFDTETHLIKPGCAAPKLVCVSVAEAGNRGTGRLLDARDGLAWARACLEDPGVRLVGHNIPYDLGVLCAEDSSLIALVFQAIDEDRIADTLLRQKIIDNATGTLKYQYDEELGEYKKQRYGLEYVVWRLLGRERAKGEDTWRLRYRELDGIPLDRWPADAVEYAIMDAEDTMAMYLAQRELEPEITGERWQTEAAWALHLVSLWGLRTDPKRVAALREKFDAEHEKQRKTAQKHGLVRPSGSKNEAAIREAIASWYEDHDLGEPKMTSGGKKGVPKISIARDVLVSTEHEGLLAVAEMGKWRKLLTTYIPILESGTRYPINPSYNAILETYRTSCSGPNVQNQPRGGGVRESYVPRNGWVYIFSDYDSLEMRSLAQVCLWLFGWSDLADAIRAGQCVHIGMAAEMEGVTYAEAWDRYEAGDPEIAKKRQHSKPANFGFPGGMGWRKFREYAKGYGIELTEDQAKALKDTFLSKWREMRDYFDYCASLQDGDKASVVEFLGSKMLRGQVSYCATCNGFFQHLAACGAKRALYEVAKACYVLRDSPLYGCRPVAFIHDEIAIEALDDGRASEAAAELQRIMVAAMQEWIPDLPITAGAVITRAWLKGAKPVHIDGKLVPGKPEKYMVDGKTRIKWVPDI